jgi:hypothetical protein
MGRQLASDLEVGGLFDLEQTVLGIRKPFDGEARRRQRNLDRRSTASSDSRSSP